MVRLTGFAACRTLEGMHRGRVWRLGHQPALDGLRGIAVLLVLMSHARVPGLWDGGGVVGVTLFFVLSGFLITALLLQEQAAGGVRLGRFYARRALRLLPALVVMVTVVSLVSAFVLPWPLVGPLEWVPTMLYASNFAALSGPTPSGFQHTWSLSVEEQFYLVWPVLLAAGWAAGKRRGVLAVALLVVAASTVMVALLWDGGAGEFRVAYGTDTRAGGLLAGCALAAWLSGRPPLRVPGWLVDGVVVAMVGAAFVVTTFGMRNPAGPLVVALLSVVLIALAVGGPSRLLAPAWLRWVGRRSYAIYLWHLPIAFATRLATGDDRLVLVVSLVGSLVAAELSWRLVEAPCLRLKSRFTATPAVVSTAH